jgi:hypothetical protein
LAEKEAEEEEEIFVYDYYHFWLFMQESQLSSGVISGSDTQGEMGTTNPQIQTI